VAPRQWGINSMKLVNCPLNGPRNAQEFICGGEVTEEPAQDAAIENWADYIFLENNTSGVVHEWWCHVASSYWFIVTRNTLSEEILATNTVDDFFASQVGES